MLVRRTRPTPARPPRTVTVTVLVGLLVGGLAGCGGGGATLGRAIPVVGGAPQEQQVRVPKVGECYQLDADALQAVNDNSSPVPCSGDHNAITYYVGTLAGDPTKFPQTSRETCSDHADDAVGLSTDEQALSVVGIAFFHPSAREYALGARAVRCDLVPQDEVAADAPPLPVGSRIPLFDGAQDIPESLRLCRTVKDLNRPCTQPHAWRAESAFQSVGGGRRRPSEDFFGTQAKRRCPKVVATKRYLWTGPSINSWLGGDRTVTCFSRQVTT